MAVHHTPDGGAVAHDEHGVRLRYVQTRETKALDRRQVPQEARFLAARAVGALDLERGREETPQPSDLLALGQVEEPRDEAFRGPGRMGEMRRHPGSGSGRRTRR